HQAGRWEESMAAFHEAEAIQEKRQPEYPRLYALWGFRYCNLLLSRAEPEDGSGLDGVAKAAVAFAEAERSRQVYREAMERATQSLDWITNVFHDTGLLEVALDYLTLGRSHLGLAMASGDERAGGLAQAAEQLDRAVDGLKRAGQEDTVPLG